MQTTATDNKENIEGLNPLQIIRLEDGPLYFGFRMTQLLEKIKLREIPEPQFLAPPPSRARGWTGKQIIEWHRELTATQVERAIAAKVRVEAHTKAVIAGKKAAAERKKAAKPDKASHTRAKA
jgi:hypothetical protein